MRNSVSDQSFYIESEEEEEVSGRVEDDEAGHGSDSSIYSSDNDNDNDNDNNEGRQQSKPNSLNPSWPQSYR